MLIDEGPPDGIDVQCECGQIFRVPRTLKAGLTNCPRCQRATRVPGGPEGLFWLLLAGAVAAVLVPAGSLLAALIVLALGAAGIALWILLS